jgi:hypothetical protein
MSFGLAVFTFIHVVLSLVGIASGFVVVYEFLTAKQRDIWTAVFLSTTVLTSVTGFFFPVEHFMPSHAVGIVSLLVLGVAIAARYKFHLSRAWRPTYVVGSVIALYLNVVVLVIQLFQKVQALHALAPTQSEPAFLATQITVLALFVVIAIAAAIRFRSPPIRTA